MNEEYNRYIDELRLHGTRELAEEVYRLEEANKRLTEGVTLLTNKLIDMTKENKRLKSRVKELKYFNDILENKEIDLLKENHELKETIEELHKISNLEMKNFII